MEILTEGMMALLSANTAQLDGILQLKRDLFIIYVWNIILYFIAMFFMFKYIDHKAASQRKDIEINFYRNTHDILIGELKKKSNEKTKSDKNYKPCNIGDTSD